VGKSKYNAISPYLRLPSAPLISKVSECNSTSDYLLGAEYAVPSIEKLPIAF
jgi:hypothetical protein